MCQSYLVLTHDMTRSGVLAYRIHAQQLDREPQERPVTDAAIFDFGIQDTGRDGASWALVNRGVPLASAADLAESPDVALAWTLRGAPHFYRRADLVDVMAATSPLSEADAGKRIFDAAKPLRAAQIEVLDGLADVATVMRSVVERPTVKGDMSAALTNRLDPVHLRWCGPCQATHAWEQPFRLAALYAGLELQPGTSPPVLQRIPGWPRRKAGPAADPLSAPERLQPIRNYLRLLGPATPQDVAAFLDAPVAVVKDHWPKDAVEVEVDGVKRWLLGEPQGIEVDTKLLRLLGGFDLFLQARDRSLVVPDKSRHKALWPTIGRPGAVLSGTELIGTWRPKAAGRRFTVRLDLWEPASKTVRAQVEIEAQRLAAHRGLELVGIE